MASLRPGLVGGRVWLSDLPSYRGFCRLSDSELGRVRQERFAWAKSAQSMTRRGGRPPAALGLWDELPSGTRVLV